MLSVALMDMGVPFDQAFRMPAALKYSLIAARKINNGAKVDWKTMKFE